jgi:hypothetical protein
MTGAFAAAAVRLAPPGFASSDHCAGLTSWTQSSMFDGFDAGNTTCGWLADEESTHRLVGLAAHCPCF